MYQRLLASRLLTDNTDAYRTAIWFYRDFVVRYAPRLTWITLLGFISASLQATALFGLNYILRQVTANQPLNVPVLQLQVDAGDIAIVGGLFILLVVVAASLLTLVESKAVLNLWRRYQLHALDALLLAVQDACRRTGMTFDDLGGASFRPFMRQGARLGALSRIVAGTIAPTLRFGTFSAYAVIMNPLLTLALLLAFIPSAGLTLLFFARRASRCARAVDDLSSEETRELDWQLEQACQGKFVPLEGDIRDSAIQRRAKALTGRLLWVEYSRFLTTAITVLVLALFFVMIASLGTTGPQDWAQILTYVIALFIAFRQLVSMASSVSNIGRFYPALVQQKSLLEALQRATSAEQLWRALAKAGLTPEALGEDEVGSI